MHNLYLHCYTYVRLAVLSCCTANIYIFSIIFTTNYNDHFNCFVLILDNQIFSDMELLYQELFISKFIKIHILIVHDCLNYDIYY